MPSTEETRISMTLQRRRYTFSSSSRRSNAAIGCDIMISSLHTAAAHELVEAVDERVVTESIYVVKCCFRSLLHEELDRRAATDHSSMTSGFQSCSTGLSHDDPVSSLLHCGLQGFDRAPLSQCWSLAEVQSQFESEATPCLASCNMGRRCSA